MVIPNDPRLSDVTFLAVAARRAQARRQACGGLPPGWEHGEGLSSLLKLAEAWEREDPEPLDDLDVSNPFARMLAEARQWQQGSDHGD